jgi:hypothetical protein
MRLPSFGSWGRGTIEGWAEAAARLDTLLALPAGQAGEMQDRFGRVLIPTEGPGRPVGGDQAARLVEIPWDDWLERSNAIRSESPATLVCVRIPLTAKTAGEAVRMVESGISVVHLEGTHDGRMQDAHGIFLKDGILMVHRELIKRGLRDECTLLAGGGISMAEHVAKAILCGADAVFVDFAILVALECRMCRRCAVGLPCPVKIGEAESGWVADRVVNLFGAWHSQLLEVMGAMGIRDARRMRGETGRAMFFEDLDRSVFGAMGVVKEGYEIE